MDEFKVLYYLNRNYAASGSDPDKSIMITIMQFGVTSVWARIIKIFKILYWWNEKKMNKLFFKDEYICLWDSMFKL